jgi:hypothetical protein
MKAERARERGKVKNWELRVKSWELGKREPRGFSGAVFGGNPGALEKS